MTLIDFGIKLPDLVFALDLEQALLWLQEQGGYWEDNGPLQWSIHPERRRHCPCQACPNLQRKNITIKLDAPSDPVEIHANRHVLKIALIHVLRYLTRLLTEGEELDIVVENSDEPLVTFSTRSEGILNRAGDEAVVNIEAVDETAEESSLELVRQNLTEHQSSLQVKSDGEGRKGISIRFPRIFQEQGAVSVGNVEQE